LVLADDLVYSDSYKPKFVIGFAQIPPVALEASEGVPTTKPHLGLATVASRLPDAAVAFL